MTKNTLMARIAAIVSTLNETSGSPESMLYIFCEMNMDDYQTIRGILVKSNWVTVKGNYVTITESGRGIARQIDSVIKAGK